MTKYKLKSSIRFCLQFWHYKNHRYWYRLLCYALLILVTIKIVTFCLRDPFLDVRMPILNGTMLVDAQQDIASYTGTPGKPLLLLFTTFSSNSSKEKQEIHTNTLHNWAALRPHVQPIFFYDSKLPPSLESQLRKLGWLFLPVPKLYQNKLPILRHMFLQAMASFTADYYGYANGDILFDESLIWTLLSLQRNKSISECFIMGRRLNHKMSDESVRGLDEARRMASDPQTQLSGSYAEDYFITTKQAFPWNSIPDFVVGRIGYDNWLVHYAVYNGLTVIDATGTLMCLHQTGQDGDLAGHQAKLLTNINLQFAGWNWNLGLTDCARLFTAYQGPDGDTKTSHIVLKQRPMTCRGRWVKQYLHV